MYFSGFTGIDQAYEEPLKPELVLEAGSGKTVEECVDEVVQMLKDHGVLPKCFGRGVTELMVPDSRIEEVASEATQLHKFEITKLDLQWVQVIQRKP